MLSVNMQYAIVGVIILAALLYVLWRLKKLVSKRTEGQCGGCDGCGDSGPKKTELLEIEPASQADENATRSRKVRGERD